MSRGRIALFLLMASAWPAAGQDVMDADAAKEFVVGRLFSYSCFDGTTGAGRIFGDGSAVGTMQPSGRGKTYFVRLPPGTLYVQQDRICASIKGLFFTPCFNLTRTSNTSFRGAISGLNFMYCDFDRGARTRIARKREPQTTGGVIAGNAPATP